MRFTLIAIVIGVLLFLSSCETFDELPKQEDLDTWTIYNASNGLVSNNIWCLFADSKGNIWAGSTTRGLMKFDGSSWTNLSSAHGLVDNYVTSIEEDASGDLWIGTLNGFSVYDGNTFTNYYGTNGNIWTVLSIKSDLEGDIWIGTRAHGLFEISSNEIKEYSSSTNEDANYVNDIDVDTEGNIWGATSAGVYKIKGSSVKFYTTNNGLSSNNIKAVLCDKWGDVWLGTWEGQYITKYEDGEFKEVSLFNSSSQAFVNTITEDTQGNIWIGLIADGVVKYDGAKMRTYTVDDGLPGITIMDVMVDNSSNIWFGSFEDGISKYSPGIED
jgi:ligand-binding sensor domain-containing protein